MSDDTFTRAGGVSTLDVSVLRALREAEKEQLREDVREAGSPLGALLARFPRVGVRAPGTLSLDDLVEHGSRTTFEMAEDRLKLCEACPPEGGACAEVTPGNLPRGALPVWQDGRIRKAKCDRFVEYEVRRRLGFFGVPPLYRDRSFRSWEARTDACGAAAEALVDFLGSAVAGRAGFLLIAGPRGSGKTHLSAAFLRNVARQAPKLRGAYRSLPSFRIVLKAWKFDSEEQDPMIACARADVLLLEDVDGPALKDPPWLRERVEDVLRERLLQMKPTVVTTHGTLDDLARRLPSLPLAGAVVCTVP